MEQLQISDKQRTAITWIMLSLFPIIGMAIDLISPALPAIATDLNASATLVKNTISLYLVSYALGNFILGLLTDAWGRRKILSISMFVFILSSLLPVFFSRIDILLLARILQGISMGGISVTARAVFSDILSPEKLIKFGPVIGTLFGIGPVVGPFLGSYLQHYYDWHACFIFFAGFIAIIYLLSLLFVPETHINRQPLKIKTITANISEIFRHKVFMGTVLIMGLIYSLGIGFNVVGPFIIEKEMGYSVIFFGRVALATGVAYTIATIVSRLLSARYEYNKLITQGIKFSLLAAIVFTLIGLFFKNNIYLLIIASTVMLFSQGSIFPISMGKGISLFRHIAGTATAVMYLVNILITSLTSFALSFFNVNSVFEFIVVYLCIMLLSVTIYYKIVNEVK